MRCMLTAPRAVAAVMPRLGMQVCAISAGAGDASILSPPAPPPGPPPPEPSTWERSSGQHGPHRLRSDAGQRRPLGLPPPPPGPKPLNDIMAFPECTENTAIGFGKHRGRTFGDVLRADPKYCNWVLTEAKRKPASCSGAFSAFVNFLHGQGIQVQQGGPEHVDERQPEDSFWQRPSDEPKVASTVQESCNEMPRGDASADLASGSADLASGQWKVTFGEKHVGVSFQEVLATDAAYCDFVIGQVLHSMTPPAAWIDSQVLSFVAYVQHMRLRADPSHTVRW